MVDVPESLRRPDDPDSFSRSKDRQRWKSEGLRESRSKTGSLPSDEGPLLLDAVDVIPPDAMLQGMASGPAGPPIPPAPDLTGQDDEDGAPPIRKSRLADT